MIDTLIDVTVDRIVPGRSGGRACVTVYCKLDNGMRGILPVSARSASELVQQGGFVCRRVGLGVLQDDKISSSRTLELAEIEKRLQVGQTLQCCVTRPPPHRSEEVYKKFTVFLSTRSVDLNKLTADAPAHDLDDDGNKVGLKPQCVVPDETDQPSLVVRPFLNFAHRSNAHALSLGWCLCTQLAEPPGKKLKLDPVSAQSFELLCYA